MTDLQMWSLIAGFFLPPIQAIIQQQHWSPTLRAIINFAACAVVGAGVAYFNHNLGGKTWVEAGLVVLVASITTYHGAWKPSGIAPQIEAGTSVRGGGTA